MSVEREVVVLSGVRTAIGDYGGALKDVPPTELAAQVVRVGEEHHFGALPFESDGA